MLGVSIPGAALPGLALVVAVSAFACTGLGLAAAALALRVRETAVLANFVMGVLLIFCGVNVTLDALPGWMAAAGRAMPLTHGIEAARGLAAGRGWSQVASLVTEEAGIGLVYLLVGLGMLRVFEVESRRRASLELA
jgi:ABC-2 type transport system permease protein